MPELTNAHMQVTVSRAQNGYLIEYWTIENQERMLIICKNLRDVQKGLASLFEPDVKSE
jgi:hypothetical protein